MTDPTLSTPATEPALGVDELNELDELLQQLQTHSDEVPEWEFCDGFLAALACSRRPIAPAEFLPLLMGADMPLALAPGQALPLVAPFESLTQQERFLQLWQRRFDEVSAQLSNPVEALDDADCYQPEAMDVAGAIAAQPEAERPDVQDEDVPALAQVWAMGFMYATTCWPEEWLPPRDKEQAEWLQEALDCIVALTDDDEHPPALNLYDEDAAPSVSQERVEALGEAIWAVYDLHQLWHSLGPRQEPVQRADTPGRNDPCSCGSGKKFKKCCGA